MLNTYQRTGAGFGETLFYRSMADMHSRKSKMLSTTGYSNLNQSVGGNRLPELTRSRSFSSTKSAKLKLTTLDATLSSVQQQLHQLQMDTRESRRFCNFLRDDLGENHLGMLKLQMTGQANKLQKMFKLSRNHDEERCRAIKADCDALTKGSRDLKRMMVELQSRVDKCQQVMGIYSGKEKHRV